MSLSTILNLIPVKFSWHADRNFKLKKHWSLSDSEVLAVSEGPQVQEWRWVLKRLNTSISCSTIEKIIIPVTSALSIKCDEQKKSKYTDALLEKVVKKTFPYVISEFSRRQQKYQPDQEPCYHFKLVNRYWTSSKSLNLHGGRNKNMEVKGTLRFRRLHKKVRRNGCSK